MVARVKGSHYQLRNSVSGRRATVPYYGRDISRATLASILTQTGITADEFLRLL